MYDEEARPAVLILAGGEGRRMGGGKPLRLLGGERLIDRAITLAQGWSDKVAVSARDPAQVGALSVPVLVDPPGLEGPLAGLASAAALGRSKILLIPCDTPFLPADLLIRLEAALGQQKAALAASDGRLHSACSLWRLAALDQLPSYLERGRQSLVGLAETIGFARVEWPPGLFLNLNRPADLAEAEARLQKASVST